MSLNAHRLIALAEIPDADRWPDTELILANVPAPEMLRARLTLQPWEARIHRRRNHARRRAHHT